MSMTLRLSAVAAASSLVALIACGSSGNSDFGSSGAPDPNLQNGEVPGFGSSSGGGSSSSGGTPCVGLRCKQVACPGGGSTTLSGHVYDPSGTVPLYNAVVYVPNDKVEPFKDGVSCDKCGAGVSGKPITTALTNAKGEFVLKDVPVGVEIPLVVQIGRWRRQVKIPAVTTACTDTKLVADETRMPRNGLVHRFAHRA